MIGQTILFDGHRLNDLFYVGKAEIGLPSFEADYESRAIGNGAYLKGMKLGTVSISIPLTAKVVSGTTVEDVLSDLMQWLDVDEPKVLQFSNDNGRWRYAIPVDAPDIQDYEWNDRLIVHFLQLDPALYGDETSVTVPSGGSVSINVGGDYPTTPTITSDAAVRDSSTSQWGVRMDDGEFVHVSIPVSTASTVAVDCGARKCSVNGATTIPTLTSDWLTFEPGAHTIRNDLGSGACEITWIERWHR